VFIDFFKLIFSKDFVSNSKEIISLLRRSKEWRKDIVKFDGTFSYGNQIESTIFIDRSIRVLKEKGWEEQEREEVKFIMRELFQNSFSYGLPSKEYSYVNTTAIITSTFIQFSISDCATNFALLAELQNQGAYDPESDKHKGLSFINKITPEFYQDNTTVNTVVVIKRQGLRPLIVEKEGDVLLFKVGNSSYVDDRNCQLFIERLSKVTPKGKVIIDFGAARSLLGTRQIREIRQSLIEAQKASDLKIAVCGLEYAPYVVFEYFEKKFPVFMSIEDALNFHKSFRRAK